MEHYSAIKKNEIMLFVEIYIEITILRQRKTNIQYPLLKKLEKMIQLNLFTNKNAHKHRKIDSRLPGERWEGEVNWEFGIRWSYLKSKILNKHYI